ncbi:hypothetical protein BH10ACT11_BH10ACT11_07590 [soil metagenome]
MPEAATRAELASGLLISKLAQISRSRLRDALSDLGLAPQEFGVLHRLGEAGPHTQLALSRALCIHPSNLVAVLDGLEHQGLILRGRDPSDRRRVVVALAPRGESALIKAFAVTGAAEMELLEPLSGQERDQLHDFLSRMLDNALDRGRGCC